MHNRNNSEIYLKEISLDDITIINSWRNDTDLISLLGANFRYINPETDEQWFKNYMNSRNTNVRCGIWKYQDNKLIGVVYLNNIDHLNQTADVSIMIGDKSEQGKGYGNSALCMILEHGFQNLNLHRISLKVLEDNIPALNLYTKIGFVQEGTLRDTLYKNGEYKNQIIMSILRDEFEQMFHKGGGVSRGEVNNYNPYSTPNTATSASLFLVNITYSYPTLFTSSFKNKVTIGGKHE